MAARIMCLIILALEARGLYISISDRRWKIFAYLRERENLGFQSGDESEHLVLSSTIRLFVYNIQHNNNVYSDIIRA